MHTCHVVLSILQHSIAYGCVFNFHSIASCENAASLAHKSCGCFTQTLLHQHTHKQQT